MALLAYPITVVILRYSLIKWATHKYEGKEYRKCHPNLFFLNTNVGVFATYLHYLLFKKS